MPRTSKKNTNNGPQVGVLDITGTELNPFTQQPYEDSSAYATLAQKWSSYPVYAQRYDIINYFKKHNVIFIKSGTGSGKTVLIPRLFEHAYNYQAKMVLTIPRKTATKLAAEFQAKINQVPIGSFIGYQYRGEKQISVDTRMLYSTDGTLVQMLLADPLLTGIDCVFVDEVHERNIQIDFLLYLLRKVVEQRPEFRLVLMSADAPLHLFETYFKDPIYNFKLIDVGEATSFPVTDVYLPKPLESDKFIKPAIELITEILTTTQDGDILCFVTSAPEAQRAERTLREKLTKVNSKQLRVKSDPNNKKSNSSGLVLFIMTGSADILQDKEREELLKNNKKYRQEQNDEGRNYNRRVSFVTNVAESSLTLNGYTYVIDSGYELADTFYPETRIQSLEYQRISNAQRLQRRGRVGRNRPGTAYYLYTEEEAKAMSAYPTAAIRRTDLSADLFRFFRLPDIQTTHDLIHMLDSFIEPPEPERIQVAVQLYVSYQWMAPQPKNKGTFEITEKGKLALAWTGGNQPIWQSEALITGWFLGVFHEVAGVLSLMEASKYSMKQLLISRENFGRKLREMEQTVMLLRKKLYQPEGDWMTLLQIWLRFRKENEKSRNSHDIFEWVDQYGFEWKTLKSARGTFQRMRQLADKLKKLQQGVVEVEQEFTVDEGISHEELQELTATVMNKQTGGREIQTIPIQETEQTPWHVFQEMRRELKPEEAVELALGQGYAPWLSKEISSRKKGEPKKYESIAVMKRMKFALPMDNTWVQLERKILPKEVLCVEWSRFRGEETLALANRVPPRLQFE